MNQGKRYLRNTACVMLGGVFLFVGLNRLHAAAIVKGASLQTRTVLALGLVQVKEQEGRDAEALLDPAAVRNFKRIVVTGGIEVEIVGAPEYKVSVTSPAGAPPQLHGGQQEDLLWVRVAPGSVTQGAVLRIETPALTMLTATHTPQLTVRGVSAQQLVVRLYNVGALNLRENQVARWRLGYSNEVPDFLLEVRADKTTLSAGSFSMLGNLAIRYTE